MATIFDKDVSAFGVPLHNPFYSSKEALCRFNLYNLNIKVKHPAIIADLVPKPLEYMGPTIHVSANRVQDFKTSLAPYISHMAWNEIEIQIPTTYKKKYYLYCSEVFTDNVGIMIPDREIFGFPKIPAKVLIEAEGKGINARAWDYKGEKAICNLTFKPLRPGTTADIGVKPRIINLKHIPSPVKNRPAEVKTLVSLKYLKQLVHELVVGEGSIEWMECAPEHLIAAGIEKIEKAIYLDLELHIDGGRIVYDYNQEERKLG